MQIEGEAGLHNELASLARTTQQENFGGLRIKTDIDISNYYQMAVKKISSLSLIEILEKTFKSTNDKVHLLILFHAIVTRNSAITLANKKIRKIK